MSSIGERTAKETPSGQKNIQFLRNVQHLPTASSFPVSLKLIAYLVFFRSVTALSED